MPLPRFEISVEGLPVPSIDTSKAEWILAALPLDDPRAAAAVKIAIARAAEAGADITRDEADAIAHTAWHGLRDGTAPEPSRALDRFRRALTAIVREH